MDKTARWTILGGDELARQLTAAARYIEAPATLAVSSDPDNLPVNAIATGGALLATGARSTVSQLYGYRVLEDASNTVRSGAAGNIYGLFGSYRLERNRTAGELRDEALAPLLAYVLEIFQGRVERVWARRASLLAPDDAWFITICLADETLLTLEALATRPEGSGPQVLIEVTGSDQVLRVEPTRQSVIVEPLNGPPQALPWWEDEAERFLTYVANRPTEIRSAERLREVWTAIEQSLEHGAAFTP